MFSYIVYPFHATMQGFGSGVTAISYFFQRSTRLAHLFLTKTNVVLTFQSFSEFSDVDWVPQQFSLRFYPIRVRTYDKNQFNCLVFCPVTILNENIKENI